MGHRKRRFPSKEERKKNYLLNIVRLRDGDVCHYCGVKTEWYKVRGAICIPNKMTLEHILPKSLGGTDDLDNLVIACRYCNNGRSSQPYEPYLERCVINRVVLFTYVTL